MPHVYRLCGNAEFMRSIWRRYDALATDGDSSRASGPRISILFVATLRRLMTSCPSLLKSLLGVSAQAQGVGPSIDSMPYLHSHILDSVMEVVVTASGATVSNVVGIIGTEVGLSVHSAAMKVQLVRPTSVSSSENRSFLLATSTNLTCRRYPNPSAWACRQCARCLMTAGPRSSPLSSSFSPFTINISDPSIWRYLQHAASARPRGEMPCLAHTAQRVPHRARESRPSTTRRRCARRTITTSAAGATLPCLTEGTHARPRRQRWGQRKQKRRRTEPAQLGMFARTRRCCDVSGRYARPQLVRGA